IRVHVPFFGEQLHLMFRKLRIYDGERYHVKSEIPCSIPWILPFVGHGNNISIRQMHPVSIPSFPTTRRRRWLSGVSFQPLRDIIVIELLTPHHACKRLTLDILSFRIGYILLKGIIKGICFFQSLSENLIEVFKGILNKYRRETQTYSS